MGLPFFTRQARKNPFMCEWRVQRIICQNTRGPNRDILRPALGTPFTAHLFIMYVVVVYNFRSVWTFHGSHRGMHAKIHYTVILIKYGLGSGNMHHEMCFEVDGRWLWTLGSVTGCQLEHSISALATCVRLKPSKNPWMVVVVVITHQLSPQQSWWGSVNSWKIDIFLGQVKIPALNFFIMFMPCVPNYDTRRQRMPSKSHYIDT